MSVIPGALSSSFDINFHEWKEIIGRSFRLFRFFFELAPPRGGEERRP